MLTLQEAQIQIVDALRELGVEPDASTGTNV
jgi:hypothetical protein